MSFSARHNGLDKCPACDGLRCAFREYFAKMLRQMEQDKVK